MVKLIIDDELKIFCPNLAETLDIKDEQLKKKITRNDITLSELYVIIDAYQLNQSEFLRLFFSNANFKENFTPSDKIKEYLKDKTLFK